MRELLELFYSELPKLIGWDRNYGLCNAARDLPLSLFEIYRILEYLKENLPKDRDGFWFCWPPGELEPRQKWLKEQIDKL